MNHFGGTLRSKDALKVMPPLTNSHLLVVNRAFQRDTIHPCRLRGCESARCQSPKKFELCAWSAFGLGKLTEFFLSLIAHIFEAT